RVMFVFDRLVTKSLEHLVIPQTLRYRKRCRIVCRFNPYQIHPEVAPCFNFLNFVPLNKPGSSEAVVAFKSIFVDLDPEQDVDHLRDGKCADDCIDQKANKSSRGEQVSPGPEQLERNQKYCRHEKNPRVYHPKGNSESSPQDFDALDQVLVDMLRDDIAGCF